MQEDNKTRKIIREYPEYDHDSSDLTDSSGDSSDDSMNRLSDQSFEDLSEDYSEMFKVFPSSSERYVPIPCNILDVIRLGIAACLSFGLTYLAYHVSVYSVIILCTILITTMISIELGDERYEFSQERTNQSMNRQETIDS